ncbi:hypothetical protein T492DRAFT_141236 [Pavlovales sp. CCMP2436]|nr:hypothetical protein T492DRAFT_141236 [Pavlovales sp. CCMP2436]
MSAGGAHVSQRSAVTCRRFADGPSTLTGREGGPLSRTAVFAATARALLEPRASDARLSHGRASGVVANRALALPTTPTTARPSLAPSAGTPRTLSDAHTPRGRPAAASSAARDGTGRSLNGGVGARSSTARSSCGAKRGGSLSGRDVALARPRSLERPPSNEPQDGGGSASAAALLAPYAASVAFPAPAAYGSGSEPQLLPDANGVPAPATTAEGRGESEAADAGAGEGYPLPVDDLPLTGWGAEPAAAVLGDVPAPSDGWAADPRRCANVYIYLRCWAPTTRG